MKISTQRYIKIGIISLIFSETYLRVFSVSAQAKYTELVGIPGISGTPSLPDYINKVYILIIAIGVLIAIMRLAFAGIKYSMSGIVTDKASAKKDIQGVLLGLAILLLPFVVLNTINPDLIRLDVLNVANKLNLGTSSDTTGNTNPVSPAATTYPSGTAFDTTNYNMTCEQQQCDAVEDYTVSQSSVDAAKTACATKGGTFTDNGTTGTCFFNASDDGGPTTSDCNVGRALEKNMFGEYVCADVS